MHSLAFHYRVGLSTVHYIVSDTSSAIWRTVGSKRLRRETGKPGKGTKRVEGEGGGQQKGDHLPGCPHGDRPASPIRLQ